MAKKIHYLKTINPYFSEIWNSHKTFELRIDDRNYEAGDEIYLKEYHKENDKYSGRIVRAEITYVLKSYVALMDYYCAFSFKVTQFIILPPPQTL